MESCALKQVCVQVDIDCESASQQKIYAEVAWDKRLKEAERALTEKIR